MDEWNEMKENEMHEVESTNMSGGKKLGWFLYIFAPMVAYFTITMIVTFFGTLIFIIREGTFHIEIVMENMLGTAMVLSMVSGIIGIIVFSFWYYFGCKRPSPRLPQGLLTVKNVFFLLAIAIIGQIVITFLINGLSMVFPQLVQDYSDLMELAGMNQLNWIVVLYVGIIGPIVEEIIFRGLTLYIARKFTARFWLANFLQSLCFGIMHMNIVQGLYAFLAGFFFGWIYKRYNSLYAAIWAHICFNCLGLLVSWIGTMMV